MGSNSIAVSKSSSRQFGFCCGDVATKCAIGCAGKSCDIQCSGTCGIFSTTCSFSCSSVSTACTNPTSASTTMTITTTAATTTAASATTTPSPTSTTGSCVAAGALCISLSDGSSGSCCSGSLDCNVFVPGVGYNCAGSATTTVSATSNPACLGAGELCLSLTDGSKGTCCSGASSCNVFVAGIGYNCAGDATT